MDSQREEQVAVRFKTGLLPLFLPSGIIAVGYGLVWLWLYSQGQGGSALARVSLVVILLVVPLLVAYNVVKHLTTFVDVFGSNVKYGRSVPSSSLVEMPYAYIEQTEIDHGLFGKYTRSTTVRMHLASGKTVNIFGLARPDQLKSVVDEACARLSG